MADRFFDTSSVVELHSIFARLVRTGEITAADFHLARRRFLADIAAGLWQVLPVASSDFHRAQHLLVQYGPVHSLRTLADLQLSLALGLNAATPLDAFVCAREPATCLMPFPAAA